MEEQCRQFRVECDSAQRDLKDVTAQLQDEQKKAIGLSQELDKNVSSKQSLMESEEKGRDLQKENSILRESNNKLVTNFHVQGGPSGRGQVFVGIEIRVELWYERFRLQRNI